MSLMSTSANPWQTKSTNSSLTGPQAGEVHRMPLGAMIAEIVPIAKLRFSTSRPHPPATPCEHKEGFSMRNIARTSEFDTLLYLSDNPALRLRKN